MKCEAPREGARIQDSSVNVLFAKRFPYGNARLNARVRKTAISARPTVLFGQ